MACLPYTYMFHEKLFEAGICLVWQNTAHVTVQYEGE